MLKQPMIEKLLAMRLHGMAESLKTQEQDPAARELSFLERLGLLVDQQWNWRENQALGRRLKNAKLRTNACVEDIDYRGARGLDKSVIRALTQESAWVGTHENVLCGLRPGSEGVPRRVPGPLHPRPIAISRPGDGACRR
jgi:DNA replication protein DnaC